MADRSKTVAVICKDLNLGVSTYKKLLNVCSLTRLEVDVLPRCWPIGSHGGNEHRTAEAVKLTADHAVSHIYSPRRMMSDRDPKTHNSRNVRSYNNNGNI